MTSLLFSPLSVENVSPVGHTLRLMHERCWGVRKVGIRADNMAPRDHSVGGRNGMAYRRRGRAFIGVFRGCSSSGNESIADASQQTVSGQLVKGRTTQAQVRQLYGDPIKTSFTDSGNESWEYEFSRLHSKPTNFIPYVNLIYSGSEGDKKSLVI